MTFANFCCHCHTHGCLSRFNLQNLPIPSLLQALQLCVRRQGNGRRPDLKAETLQAGFTVERHSRWRVAANRCHVFTSVSAVHGDVPPCQAGRLWSACDHIAAICSCTARSRCAKGLCCPQLVPLRRLRRPAERPSLLHPPTHTAFAHSKYQLVFSPSFFLRPCASGGHLLSSTGTLPRLWAGLEDFNFWFIVEYGAARTTV